MAAAPKRARGAGDSTVATNPLASKKHKWRPVAARPAFDVHKFSPSIMVWTEAECNPWRRVMFKSPRDRSPEELDMLEATLTPKVEWLRRVVAPIRKDIYRRCRLERLRKGDVLFEQGDAGKAFYIILSGMVNVNVRVEDCTRLEDIHMIKHIFEKGDATTLNSNGQHTVNTLGPMQWFGGMALGDDNATRMASIVAIENTLLMAIPRSDFEMAVRAYEAEKAITALRTLRSTPYFHDCPLSSLKRLAAASSIHEFAAGQVVVKQDTPAHSLIIVVEGALHVYRQLPLPLEMRQGLFGVEAAMKGRNKAKDSQRAGKACLKIADFAASDTLGVETILNQHHMHRFTVKAVTKCKLLTVPRNDVSALFGADPEASKSARKLSLMRLPSDESLLRRIARGLNWDLFKVGLITSVSDKLRVSLGERITVAPSTLDYRFAPAFDEEALDIVDESLMSKTVTGNTRMDARVAMEESMGIFKHQHPVRYNPHRVLRSVRGTVAAEVTLPPSTSKPALRRLHGSMSTPALLPAGKSFRSSAKTLETWNAEHDVTMEALTEGAKVPRKWQAQYLSALRKDVRPKTSQSTTRSNKDIAEMRRTLPATLRSMRRARKQHMPHTAPLTPAAVGLTQRPVKHVPLSSQRNRKAKSQKRRLLRVALSGNPVLRKSASAPTQGGDTDKSRVAASSTVLRAASRKRAKDTAKAPRPPKRSTALMLRGIDRSRPATRNAYAQIVREDRLDADVAPAEYASRKHERNDAMFRSIGIGLQTLGDHDMAEKFVEAVAIGNARGVNMLLHRVSLATLKAVVTGEKTSEAQKMLPRVKAMYERRLAEAERAKLNMRLYGNPFGATHTASQAAGIYSGPYDLPPPSAPTASSPSHARAASTLPIVAAPAPVLSSPPGANGSNTLQARSGEPRADFAHGFWNRYPNLKDKLRAPASTPSDATAQHS